MTLAGSHVACSVAIMALFAAVLTPSAAQAEELGRHRLSLNVGLPVPLSVHGKYPDPGETSLDFVGQAVLGYDAAPFDSIRWLRLGAELSVVHFAGSLGDASGRVTFWTGHAVVGIAVRPVWAWHWLVLRIGGGPGLLRNRVFVDEYLNKTTHSFGGRGYAMTTVHITARLGISVRAALDVFAEPFDEPTWYNQPLGETNFTSYGVGVEWSF